MGYIELLISTLVINGVHFIIWGEPWMITIS